MLKIIIISIVTIYLSIVLKNRAAEFSLLITISGSLLLLFLIFDYFSEVLDFYIDLGSGIGIDNDLIKISLKIVVIGILTEFVSDLAVDFGNNAIASKVIFGGRVVICVIMLPIVKELVLLLFSFY